MAVKEELIDIQKLTPDKDGKMLVWVDLAINKDERMLVWRYASPSL